MDGVKLGQIMYHHIQLVVIIWSNNEVVYIYISWKARLKLLTSWVTIVRHVNQNIKSIFCFFSRHSWFLVCCEYSLAVHQAWIITIINNNYILFFRHINNNDTNYKNLKPFSKCWMIQIGEAWIWISIWTGQLYCPMK